MLKSGSRNRLDHVEMQEKYLTLVTVKDSSTINIKINYYSIPSHSAFRVCFRQNILKTRIYDKDFNNIHKDFGCSKYFI